MWLSSPHLSLSVSLCSHFADLSATFLAQESEIIEPDRITSGHALLSSLLREDLPPNIAAELQRLFEKGAVDLDHVHRLTSHAVSILLLHHTEAYLHRIAPGLKDGTVDVKTLIDLVHKHPPSEEDRLTKVVDHDYLPGWIRQVQRAVTVCTRERKAKDNLNNAELEVLKPLQLEIGILSSLLLLLLFSLCLHTFSQHAKATTRSLLLSMNC